MFREDPPIEPGRWDWGTCAECGRTFLLECWGSHQCNTRPLDHNEKFIDILRKVDAEARKPTTTPKHYDSAIQPYDAIVSWDLNFALGNTVKYIARAGKKEGNTALEDLRKAVDYLQREIKRLEQGK